MAKIQTKGTRDMQSKELDKANSIIFSAIKNPPLTLEAAEEAFIKADEFREYSTLLSALAVWQIAENKLYLSKFRTFDAYLLESKTRLHVSRAHVFECVKIAEAYKQYHAKLRDAGFKEHKDVSKLRIFYKAMEVHGEAEAIKKLPKLSYREYKRWIVEGHLLEEDTKNIYQQVEISSDGIRYQGKMVVSLQRIINIYESGEEPFFIGIRNAAERRALASFLKRKRQEWEIRGENQGEG